MDELLAMAFQASPAMMIVFHLQSGRIIAVNQRCADQMGLSIDEMVGEAFQGLKIWDDPDDVQRMMALLRRYKKISGQDLLGRLPNGEPWHARIAATIGTFKQEDYAIATLEDVTANKQMEEKLHQSEEFYRLLAECAGDVIWVMDLEGRFVYISHAIEYRMGYQPEEVVGKSFEPLLTPDSAARARELLNRVSEQLQSGQRVGCQRVEFELIPKHEGLFWSEVNFCGMYNAAGDFIGLQGVSRDVTDRKRAEEAARDSLRMLTDLAQNLPGATFQFFVRPDGTRGFHYVSPRAQEMFDLPINWRLGLNVHPEDSARFMESVDEALKTRRPWIFEGRFLLKSGESRWFQGLARPSQKGNEVIFNGVLLDITERKQAEEALREATRRKDEFLMMLAHELRNPLAPIRNAVEVIKMSGPDVTVQNRHLAMIDRQLGHMSRLIDDLLDLARITRGVLGIHKAPIALNEVIGQAIEVSPMLAGPRKDDFSCTLPDEKLMVEGDFTRLVQAIGNILDNAIKYSEQGQKISLTVYEEPSATPGLRPEAVVRVQDQGAGINPEIMPHIFDIFVQADRSLDRSRGGLGIGLTLTRRIVELHGGSIQASSAGPGCGSTFYLRLPAIPNQSEQHPLDRGLHPDKERRSGVLVVDDSTDELESLAELLTIWGYAVETAAGGVQALEKFTHAATEIVLLDIGLPGMDGYTVAREMRKLIGDAPLLLIAITGYGDETSREQTFQAGFDFHFIKPIDLERLQKLLETYQSGQHVAGR